MPKRVLIVDDEESVTFSLYQSFILAQSEFEVVTASSGEEALQKTSNGRFDLVITDIFMPGISGFELIKRIKEQHPDTTFFVITAYGSEDYRKKAENVGAKEYIEKPFNVKDFRQKVLDFLE